MPYKFEITDKSYFAYNAFYYMANVIKNSLICYVDMILERDREGKTVSFPVKYNSLENWIDEVLKIVKGFEILGDDNHPLNGTDEGDKKIQYALDSFADNFPDFWI